MKIAVIGPGAMGLLFGSYLSQHHDVTLVGTNPAKMQSITERRYHPRDGRQRAHLPPTCYRRHHRPLPCRPGHRAGQGQRLRGRADQKQGPHRSRHHPDDPAKRYGPRNLAEPFRRREQIVIGTTQQGSYKLGETTVCHSGLGKTFLGAVTGDSSRFAPLAEMFAGCGFPCEVCSQVQGMIWDKLMINASSSVLSGILQVAQGYVEQDSHAWTLAEKLIRELCAAATADGYPFDAEEQIARIRLHLQKAPDGFTSIYADLKAGRRTEVDVINGAVVEAGHRHNIPVPTHEFVMELVHAMEGRA